MILDVVEGASAQAGRADAKGSAMEALQHMRGMIASRPQSFASVSEAIEWQCVAGLLIRLITQRDLADAAQSRIRSRVRAAAAQARRTRCSVSRLAHRPQRDRTILVQCVGDARLG